MAVAEFADTPDGFQKEGIAVHALQGRRQNDTNHVNRGNRGRNGWGAGFVAQLGHYLAHPVTGFFADGRVVVANTGNGGGRNTGLCRNILDGYSHEISPDFLYIRYR
jgi:hypothetical protein